MCRLLIIVTSFRILYVGCGPVLRLFSTDTGEHLQDVEISAIAVDKPEGSIVDIYLHPFDKTVLIMCFEEGRVIAWSSETNTVVHSMVCISTYEFSRFIFRVAVIFKVVNFRY